MLKSTYPKLDEIPEGDRQHYKKISDRYVLELDGDHPVQAQVATITEEKRTELAKVRQQAATAEAEVQTLKTQAANQPTLPAGHVAVPADEAALLATVKELGEGADAKAKVESVKTKLTEYATLTTENATLKKTDLLRQVADAGIDGKKLKPSVLQTLDNQAGGLSYEERDVSVTKDGKTTTEKAWHVKDVKGNKWVPLREYSDTHWKDFNASLLADESAGGTKVPGMLPNDKGDKPNDLYKKIRDGVAEQQKRVVTEAIPLDKRLGMSA
jgi:hypothetical protein